MKQEKQDYITECFKRFFERNGLIFLSTNNDSIVYQNTCSRLIFKFDIRYKPAFESIILERKSDGKRFYIHELINLFTSGQFETEINKLTTENGELVMTDIEAYSILMMKYMPSAVGQCDYSWEEDYDKYIADKFSFLDDFSE